MTTGCEGGGDGGSPGPPDEVVVDALFVAGGRVVLPAGAAVVSVGDPTVAGGDDVGEGSPAGTVLVVCPPAARVSAAVPTVDVSSPEPLSLQAPVATARASARPAAPRVTHDRPIPPTYRRRRYHARHCVRLGAHAGDQGGMTT